VVDHYCTLKNQAVLRAKPPADAGLLVFSFDPASAVCGSPDAPLYVLAIELPPYGSDRLKTKLQMQNEKRPAEELVFLFDRKP
jgi:hypothetical protein